MSPELDLDDLPIFDCKSCVFGFGDERCEGCDVRGRGDCGGVTDAFCDFLALVDFGYFSLEKLVAALAKVEDVRIGFAPC